MQTSDREFQMQMGSNNTNNPLTGSDNDVKEMGHGGLDDLEVSQRDTCDNSRPGSVVPARSTVSSSGYSSPVPDQEFFLSTFVKRQASVERRLENIEAQGAKQEQSQARLERNTRETNTLVKQLLDSHDTKAHHDRVFCDNIGQRLEKLEKAISHCVQPSKLQEIKHEIHAICGKLKATGDNWKDLAESLELEAEHLDLEMTIEKVEGILRDLKRKLQAPPSRLSPSIGQAPLTSAHIPEEVDSLLQKLKEVKISDSKTKNSAEIEGNGNQAILCGHNTTFNFVEKSGRRSAVPSAARRRLKHKPLPREVQEQRRHTYDTVNTGTERLQVQGRMYGSATHDSSLFPSLTSAQHHASNRASPMKFLDDDQQDSSD
ncbi:uncharacterized protein LOC144864538 [Branchiostoma floridae x Branchiostoma japonicum]